MHTFSLLSAFVLAATLFAANGAEHLCAEEANRHLLVNVNKRSSPLVEWVVPPSGRFYFSIADDFSYVRMQGTLIPRNHKDPWSHYLNLDYLLYNEHNVSDCFCASNYFQKLPQVKGFMKWPNYKNTEKFCNGLLAENPQINPEGLKWCPTCEFGQCQRARELGASEPIWQDWSFYNQSSGSMTGPGVELFRQTIKEVYPVVNASINQCTPTLQRLPSAQMFCTNYSNPEEGRGWGVNAKNQKCGLSFWFNCEEDLEALNAETAPLPYRGHVADINLDIITCPTDSPTSSPTTSPTLNNNCITPPFANICCGLFCFDTERTVCQDLLEEVENQGCVVNSTFFP
mmetsp:Transcript_7739/g.8879  ORF Transcript_7739/g.8879 Transcript_7739/m.8879 type:complete len:343 (-) Transcript_7739:52-1080(-)